MDWSRILEVFGFLDSILGLGSRVNSWWRRRKKGSRSDEDSGFSTGVPTVSVRAERIPSIHYQSKE